MATTAGTGIAGGGAPAGDAARPRPAAARDPGGCLAGEDLASPACTAAAGAVQADLTWLLHRCAQRLRGALDEAARGQGLSGARDWIVLSAIAGGPRQTQLALAHSLGLDKTTMTSLLDRLEAAGLIARGQDSRDRRARIPALTTAGDRVQRALIAARDQAEADVLRDFNADEQRVLRAMLGRLAAGPADGPGAAGSCM